jgi:hypothetical protein
MVPEVRVNVFQSLVVIKFFYGIMVVGSNVKTAFQNFTIPFSIKKPNPEKPNHNGLILSGVG